MTKPHIHAFFDEPTNTVSYLVADPATRRAAVIDPVLDYDHKTGKASAESADAILAQAAAEGLTIDWVLETHVHADHLSGAPYIKLKTGAKVGDRRAHPRGAEDLPAGLQRHRCLGRRAASSTTCSRTASVSGSASWTAR